MIQDLATLRAFASVSSQYMQAIEKKSRNDMAAMDQQNERTTRFFIEVMKVLGEDISIPPQMIHRVIEEVPDIRDAR